jgi:AcrR family transcriptional regulator
MATANDVKPNRRGLKSRELVLDAAERVMAEHGFEAATLAAVVTEAGIPPSSVYHYFGSKDGLLLAVMERGAEHFFADVPDLDERLGSPLEHLERTASIVITALERNPDFLRLLIAFAVHPPGANDVHEVVDRVREMALRRLRKQLAMAFGEDPRSRRVDRLARFALATIDGAFVARQTDRGVTLQRLLELLPTALVAVHEVV